MSNKKFDLIAPTSKRTSRNSILFIEVKKFEFSAQVSYLIQSDLSYLNEKDWIPKKGIHMNLLQDLYDALKKIQSPGFDVDNSVDDNIVALVDDLLNNLNGLDPKASLEEVVNAFVNSTHRILLIKILPIFSWPFYLSNLLLLVLHMINYDFQLIDF
ncbi:uncharacterized protein LOC128396036 [Panonychus citri]|uniref:uncharacterized protein LOC128396036 n=1 Tax=Panonychus citri TaxID=50023 RepID=UPI002307E6EA|nr:uncharacterized protein LOC128396036 [Panonychus citri]